MKEELVDKAKWKVYTDGSAIDGGVGAAAVLFEDGKTDAGKALTLHLGPTEHHTVYEGEAVGGILAAKLLQEQDIKVDEGISIYVDNQSVISGAKKIHNRSAQYLLNEFHDALLRVPTVKLFARSNKLSIRWISAHSGVEGNEMVDKLAKAAAQGYSSPKELIPKE
ncbi:ribonuclease H-like protein, partial [Pluteus cervinus]